MALLECRAAQTHRGGKKKKSENTGSHRTKKHYLHQPGIEPGSVPWQGTILPLDHWCFDVVSKTFILLICTHKNFSQSTSTLKKSGHTAPSLIHYRARNKDLRKF